VMLNCIGTMPSEQERSAFPEISRMTMAKEGRPGRKVGHLTFPASAVAAIAEWQKRLAGLISLHYHPPPSAFTTGPSDSASACCAPSE